MIDLTISPIIFSVGPVAIRYYGLVYALGFIFTYFYLRWQIKNKRLKLNYDQLDTFLIYMILAVVVGGRVGEFLFYQWDVLINNPLQILKVWQGGMSFHGGVLGVIVAMFIFCKKYKVNFYDITDHLVIPASIMLFFGRIANFINQELVGRLSDVSWCVNFVNAPNPSDRVGCRHPSQLYEALKNLFMFGVLSIMDARQWTRRKYAPGFLTWMFVLMYGILRTIVNVWRNDELIFFGIFGMGQVLSIIMALVAGFVLIYFYWLKPKKNKKVITEKKSKKKKGKKK